MAQQQGQAQQKVWNYSLAATLFYDSFESDDGLIESDRLSEYFVLSGSRGNLWYAGDSLSITGKFGFVQAWPERAGIEDDVHATPTDIFLSAGYSSGTGRHPASRRCSTSTSRAGRRTLT